VGATKELNLIFESLDKALCILAALGKSLTELTKDLQVSGSPSYFSPISSLGFSVEFPAIRIIYCAASIKEPSHFSSEEF